MKDSDKCLYAILSNHYKKVNLKSTTELFLLILVLFKHISYL